MLSRHPHRHLILVFHKLSHKHTSFYLQPQHIYHLTHITTRNLTSAPPHPNPDLSRRPIPHPKSTRERHGGQNLSERYLRLEKSLRGKASRTRDVEGLANARKGVVVPQVMPSSGDSPLTVSRDNGGNKRVDERIETFRGFRIPRKPEPPKDDECCMSGCAICVYDLYYESMAEYTASSDALQNSLTALGIPEHEWPRSIQNPPTNNNNMKKSDQRTVVLDAFAEMERALKAKRESTTTTGVLTKSSQNEHLLQDDRGR